jgi:hypothetical protein
MTGGQAKGNRHLTPLMLAYILEMSTYYNESISIYVYCKRTPRTVLYCNVVCSYEMKRNNVHYTNAGIGIGIK